LRVTVGGLNHIAAVLDRQTGPVKELEGAESELDVLEWDLCAKMGANGCRNLVEESAVLLFKIDPAYTSRFPK
jgi:hypothetical protein